MNATKNATRHTEINCIDQVLLQNRSFAFVEFKDTISVKRTYTNKIFIKGKHVKVTLSKLAMELILSRTVVFFYEAHEYCNKKKLEQHFKQYGQVFR